MPTGALGEKYCQLEVIDLVPEKIGKRHAQIRVRCDCGTVKTLRRGNFRQGQTKSCGCHRKARMSGRPSFRRKPHGMASANAVYCGYRGDARDRNLAFELSFDEFFQLMIRPCSYCGDLPRNKASNGFGSFTYNGIDRIDNAKGYIPGNVATCCRICNRGKANLSIDEWRAYLNRIAVFLSI